MAPVTDNNLDTLKDFEEGISIPLTATPGCSEQTAKNQTRKRKAKDKDTEKNVTSEQNSFWKAFMAHMQMMYWAVCDIHDKGN